MSTVEIISLRIRLWCLVRGSNKPFKVVIGQDNDIDDLRKIIREEIDANDLDLWSVNVDQSQLSVKSFSIEELLTDKNKLTASADTVGANFSYVGGTSIRVIVGVPVATGKLIS